MASDCLFCLWYLLVFLQPDHLLSTPNKAICSENRFEGLFLGGGEREFWQDHHYQGKKLETYETKYMSLPIYTPVYMSTHMAGQASPCGL